METVGMSMGSVPLPQSHTATIVVWNDLDLENAEILLEAPTLKDVKEILAEIFHLNNFATVQKEGILLNLYTYAVQFAREEDFRVEQLSAYFSIVKRVHEVCIESPFGNLDETFAYFKDLLVTHSVCRPPFSIQLFSSEEIKKISDHVINTYFRHFKLYKFAFTQQVRLDLVLNYTGPSDSDASQEIHIDSEKEEKEKSESEESQEELITAAEKEAEVTPEPIKEEEFKAEEYLKKLITEFLQVEIDEIKLSIKEKLRESEQMLSNKLEEIGTHEEAKKSVKKVIKLGKK
ncbi:Hypothetical predicted protein [Octopus vulgaris]|uniref:Coiled-coil domain-containing protein 189 n=1 Tax=Octopus vulgaris TaxID=6645 RepID=A0AA36FAK1_OCTVU|nr:Hypothetical predicted protein [Octopus vulgaris]